MGKTEAFDYSGKMLASREAAAKQTSPQVPGIGQPTTTTTKPPQQPTDQTTTNPQSNQNQIKTKPQPNHNQSTTKDTPPPSSRSLWRRAPGPSRRSRRMPTRARRRAARNNSRKRPNIWLSQNTFLAHPGVWFHPSHPSSRPPSIQCLYHPALCRAAAWTVHYLCSSMAIWLE